jgi:large subunit ribosomal protein L30
MKKVRITLKKSIIDRSRKQKDTVKALGLGKINSSIEKDLSPQVEGMIKKVAHLVAVENI